ncbi:MAG TPA: ATP-binding cassette domain-containing protein [Pseudomonadales bacterium]|nr:ATP-binding cassette domain-containing protein [Pseudomonadales bacterium]HNJ73678.1 ATP-binding cassette domain-containing protein [Pseudomonadales bacterium]
MLTLEQISLHRGGRPVLTDCSLRINSGDRIGLVGANGAGKSSLMQLILGQLAPDGGQIALQSGVRLAHLEQEHAAEQRCALEVVIDGDSQIGRLRQALAAAEQTGDHEALATLHQQFAEVDGYRAESRAGEILHGLGVTPAQQRQSVRALSGGLRVRVQLARALMTPSDLLLLDEPTNHLDLDAILWLESWLARYPGSLLVISHDRDFFDHVVNQILHLDSGVLTRYAGHYSDFERSRAEARRQQASAYQRQQQQLQQTQRFIDRFKAKASKAKQAQSRMKALEKLERIVALREESTLRFSLPSAERISNPLLVLDRISVARGERTLIEHFSATLLPDTRVALLGRNGAGKSTLLAAIAGLLPLAGGTRLGGEHLKIGYFAQHQLEALDLTASPLLHLKRLDPRASEQSLRGFLGGFGFSAERALTAVEAFSGGEKSRLALALIAWQRPNLLLLDEPTNHLDLDMRQALVEALLAFEGAVLLISHDRHLLESCAAEFWLIEAGRATLFEGDLDDYARHLASSRSGDGSAPAADGASRRASRQNGAALRQQQAPLRQQVKKIEAEIDRLGRQLAQIEQQLAEPELYGGEHVARLRQLSQQQQHLRSALTEQEEQWMAASMQLETLAADP